MRGQARAQRPPPSTPLLGRTGTTPPATARHEAAAAGAGPQRGSLRPMRARASAGVPPLVTAPPHWTTAHSPTIHEPAGSRGPQRGSAATNAWVARVNRPGGPQRTTQPNPSRTTDRGPPLVHPTRPRPVPSGPQRTVHGQQLHARHAPRTGTPGTATRHGSVTAGGVIAQRKNSAARKRPESGAQRPKWSDRTTPKRPRINTTTTTTGEFDRSWPGVLAGQSHSEGRAGG